jgi:hypothetical protein
VSLSGAVGSTPLPFQLRPIIVPAPPEGVVRQAFATTVAAGPPTARLPASSTRAYAYFRFATQPASGRPLTVAWYWPDGRLLGTVQKSNRPEVVTHLESSVPIDRGTWVAELRAGSQIVQRLAVPIG